MTRRLIGLSLIAAASATNPISVVCNDDNTIDVEVAYDQKAEVLEFSYGDCNLASAGRANFTQKPDYSFAFQLDVDVCNMNDKLRTLKYNQTASMRIGRKSGGSELTLATFNIDSYCTYTSSYKVKFSYGNIEAETATYSSDAGLVNVTFALKSYNADYSKEETHSTKAGKMINLGLSVTNTNFDHADDIAASTTGKVFAPKSCKVVNDNNEEYSLFDSSTSCANDDIDFKIQYDQASNIWQFSHLLFLLNDDRVSKLDLECDVIVCDASKKSDCDAVVRACIKPVDGEWSTFSNWTNCNKPCGNGTQTRSRSCTPQKFFGNTCSGNASESQSCNEFECTIAHHPHSIESLQKHMDEEGSQRLPKTTNSSHPDWPSSFYYVVNGNHSDFRCVRFSDGSDANSPWNDNFLCHHKSYEDPEFEFSANGEIAGKKCVSLNDRNATGWDNKYLCMPAESPYNLTFKTEGAEGQSCIQITEPEDSATWKDNFLCGEQIAFNHDPARRTRRYVSPEGNTIPHPTCGEPSANGWSDWTTDWIFVNDYWPAGYRCYDITEGGDNYWNDHHHYYCNKNCRLDPDAWWFSNPHSDWNYRFEASDCGKKCTPVIKSHFDVSGHYNDNHDLLENKEYQCVNVYDDSDGSDWSDNYFCIPAATVNHVGQQVNLQWHESNPGQSILPYCSNWGPNGRKAEKYGWGDNYMCGPKY